MFDYDDFLSKDKCLLIAPAGFGKTHTIAECLKHVPEKDGKQLILTHTNAGVAAIKSKIAQAGIAQQTYHVETISGLAQKYVLAFYNKTDIPEYNNIDYHPFIIKEAIKILNIPLVQMIVQDSYNGIFVDEYQDCTIDQHHLILHLSLGLPTRILGDYMQGIFGFAGSLVNLQDNTQMTGFSENTYKLETPYRWELGNKELGEDLKAIREKLIADGEIDLSDYKSIRTYLSDNIYKDLRKQIYYELNSSDHVLVIDPNSANVASRLKFVSQFNNLVWLVEAIDGKDFYLLAKDFDLISNENIRAKLLSILLKHKIFNQTRLKEWLNDKGVKTKRNEHSKMVAKQINDLLVNYENSGNNFDLVYILEAIRELPKVKCYRRDIFSSLCKALKEGEASNVSVIDATRSIRNSLRKTGRKISGRCIGTTLLTKGLEFETVIVLNANKFDNPKHLYVALSRAIDHLVVISERSLLSPGRPK